MSVTYFRFEDGTYFMSYHSTLISFCTFDLTFRQSCHSVDANQWDDEDDRANRRSWKAVDLWLAVGGLAGVVKLTNRGGGRRTECPPLGSLSIIGKG